MDASDTVLWEIASAGQRNVPPGPEPDSELHAEEAALQDNRAPHPDERVGQAQADGNEAVHSETRADIAGTHAEDTPDTGQSPGAGNA